MEIVIKIPEEIAKQFDYEYCVDGEISKYITDTILEAYCNGIPLEQMLEQIRAEILSLPTVVWNMVRRTRVFEIIDKYREEQEDADND